MKRLTRFFIPANFGDDDIKRKRAEIAIGTVFFIVPWGLTASVFVFWLTASIWTALFIASSPLIIATAPLVLRNTGDMNLTSLVILAPLFATFTAWSLGTGGILAPGASWLMILPLLALLFRGFRAASMWLVAVLMTWGGMLIANNMGLLGLVEFDEQRFLARRTIELFALSTTVFGLFYLKDDLQNWLIAVVNKKAAETKAVVETAPDGILTIDLDGMVLDANEATAQIFETPARQLRGHNIKALVETLNLEELQKRSDLPLASRDNEEHLGHRHQQTFPLEVAFGLIDDDEQPRIVLVLRDITDRKAAEGQLRKARDQAVQASQAKSTFLANMSHELRTPLNAVIGYSEMLTEEIEFLEEDGVPGAEVATQFIPDLARIQSAGQHLLSLINDILDLSKIEAGKMTTHIETFAVSELIDDIAATIEPLVEQNGNILDIDVADQLPTMRSDPTKVRQILFNLLSNACKFTKDGTIRLQVEFDETDDEILFSVEDTGIGMTEDELQKVFDSFSQADDSTTRKFGGTGLGLTITSHFCALLGGSIDVSSTPGEGTTFHIRLARALDEDEDSDRSHGREPTGLSMNSSAAEDTAPADGADTILVIDDDPSVRDLFGRMLKREGYKVVTAANGSEGLFLAQKVRPSAITLDVMMPSMDGWTMLASLKEDPELADIPIIMVSMLSEQNRGYALGADHYLVKPVERQELLELLQSYRGTSTDSGTVLIVEDHEPTRTLIRRTLTRQGWDVVESSNGLKAIESLEEMTPDLVLLDLMMPEMDGFQFLEQFRKDDAYRHIPVIVVTAKELTPEEQQKLNHQVASVLSKSGIDKDKLLAELRDMIDRARESADVV